VAKKASDRQQAAPTENKGNLDAQDYIASQYPTVDGGVSSTVRLGRSLVSGAMGRWTDDPKMFETAVELMDCSVPLRTTKEKAKIAVSKLPPNSIDFELEEDEVCDARLLQSTTDTGVHIELPEGNAEIDDQGVREMVDKDSSTGVGNVSEGPKTPGCVTTPVRSSLEGGIEPSRRIKEITVPGKRGRLEGSKNVTPRSVVLAECIKLIEKIDASALM